MLTSNPAQRLAKWFTTLSPKEKAKIIKDVTQLVLSRRTRMCNFLEYKGTSSPSPPHTAHLTGLSPSDSKVVYRRYASLFFIAGCESTDNELITLEVVHRYVEQMDKYYGNVCELDIIFNFQKAYFILDELLLAGEMQDSSKKNVLRCISQQDSLEDMEVSRFLQLFLSCEAEASFLLSCNILGRIMMDSLGVSPSPSSTQRTSLRFWLLASHGKPATSPSSVLPMDALHLHPAHCALRTAQYQQHGLILASHRSKKMWSPRSCNYFQEAGFLVFLFLAFFSLAATSWFKGILAGVWSVVDACDCQSHVDFIFRNQMMFLPTWPRLGFGDCNRMLIQHYDSFIHLSSSGL